ncbi:MAG: TIGR04552 family protein [Deltaproteobacteria bacterium]|nr:MAG: TIGR04552 family protein [Deltaproteobacteria bacterium]
MTSLPKTLSDREAIIFKHAFLGDSVIDWSRLFFTDEESVLKFLRLNEFDPSKTKDLDRLGLIHQEAVDYLQNHLHFDISAELKDSTKVIPIFLKASQGSDKQLIRQSCAILKTMNIIHHIDGRELLYNCSISLRDLFSLVEDKIVRSLSYLSRTTSQMVHYEGGRKSKDSLVTKLLSKRESIAAQINDRVRYRITAKTKDDIVKITTYLFDTLIPFNYVIPNASTNQLFTLDMKKKDAINKLLHINPLYAQKRSQDFTAKTYKVCKFVADIPIRMDNFLAQSGGPAFRESLGNIAFVLVEFQIVDEETSLKNNAGDASHERYKIRQKTGVVKRLIGSK